MRRSRPRGKEEKSKVPCASGATLHPSPPAPSMSSLSLPATSLLCHNNSGGAEGWEQLEGQRSYLLPTVQIARLTLSHKASQCGTASMNCEQAPPRCPASLALYVSDVGTLLCATNHRVASFRDTKAAPCEHRASSRLLGLRLPLCRREGCWQQTQQLSSKSLVFTSHIAQSSFTSFVSFKPCEHLGR